MPSAAGILLVPRGSSWKYNNLNVDLGTSWRNPGYNDSGWPGSGPGPLGGGDAHMVTSIYYGPADARYPTIYFRRTFTLASTVGYSGLTLRVLRDDGAIVYLNGVEVQAVNVTTPIAFSAYSAMDAGDPTAEMTYFEFSIPASSLVNGLNTLAVEGKQATLGSSDFGFDLELEGAVDEVPPILAGVSPPQGADLLSLTSVSAVFGESVKGVNAPDLLINMVPATSVVTNNPNDYTFYFLQPATGTVHVAFSQGHGITDYSPLLNPFGGGNWTYHLDTNAATRRNFLISEFLADNDNGMKDEDGERNDWLELLNNGPLSGNLDGWFLTDDASNLTKWRVPAVVLPNNGYVVIWCSSKNRTALTAPLHTNFKLQKEAGGFLALVDEQTNIISSFTYPVQSSDISYGRDVADRSLAGYFSTPTPGAQNITSGPGILGAPVFSRTSGVYADASLSLTISNTNGIGTIRYTSNGTLPASNSTVYTVPIILSANSTIKARVFPPAGTNLLPSAVGARNFVFLHATTTNFTSRLPILIISTEGRPISADVPPGSPRTKGSLVVIDTFRGRSSIQGQADAHELAEFEYSGQTSLGFAKQPIRFEIHDALGNGLDKGLLGMPADSDWRLRNPYNDKTLLNDFLGYELWEKMGHYSVRRKFVEVFRDTGGGRLIYPGDYYGVMVLCETIKVNNDRVDIPKISPYSTNLAVTDGGFMFKRDKDSTGDLNFSSPGGGGFSGIPLKLHEPKPNDLRNANFQGVTTWFPGDGYTTSGTNQMNYLRNFLGTMESVMYAADWTIRTGTNHYSYYLDPVAFADQMLHVEFTKQIDGYRLSDYFTKGRDGRIGPGPVWDWNLAFGNADYLLGGQTNGWYYELAGDADHPWARRLITGTTGGTSSSGDPNFVQLIADRWSMFRTNVLNGTNLLQEIDELSTLLSEAAARDLYGKYRSGLIGVYSWPNPDGGVAVNGSTGSVDGRDVDFVRPTNYLGAIETVAPATATNSIIGQMKKWMLGRSRWMDSQFTPAPTFSAPGGMVTNGFRVTLAPPPGATLYYTLNGTDPRVSGGGVRVGALSANGPVTVTISSNTRIVARAKTATAWKNTWSGPTASTYFTTFPPLRITEVMYHPAPPPPGLSTDEDNFEFIEVKNISGISLNVNGYSLAGGIQFVFGSLTLGPGQSAVVVKDLAAFQSRYGTNNPSILIAGVYTGKLANDGDRIILYDNLLVPIHDFFYSDDWYPATDGVGFSLVTANENSPPGNLAQVAGWRPSSSAGGSPGASDPPAPPRPPVLINEVLAHSDLTPGLTDSIEIHNPTAAPAAISGWFLTDDFKQPRKFAIPTTILPPGGYVTFTEADFNASPGSSNSFALSATGGEVFLFSGNGVSLTGYAHGFDFGPSPDGVTFGRYVISTGAEEFVAQRTNTLNTTNAGPLVGPLIVSEIQYQPLPIVSVGQGFDNTDDEFIELRNIGSTNVAFYDPIHPTNTWQLRDAVAYRFPAGTSIPSGGSLLVVPFDPATNAAATAAYRNRNYIQGEVPLYGPWQGELGNGGDSVELCRPDLPETNGLVPAILVERVRYSASTPWAAGADGYGLTLQRIVNTSYGNDPTNWVVAAPTPGSDFVGGTAPAITSQPGNLLIVQGTNVMLSATATGTAPLRYQWYYNGLPINGANASVYGITNVQLSAEGVYNIFVYNGGGSVFGTNFTLATRVGLRITTQPTNMVVVQGNSVTNRVAAVGTGNLRYQWKRNSVNILNATNATLVITNAQLANQGAYIVEVRDDYDMLFSQEVSLMFKPVIVLQPVSQTALLGGTAQFGIIATGTLPIGFHWRKAGILFTGGLRLATPTNSILIVTNVQFTDATDWTCVASNIAGLAANVSDTATLTVLADMDTDGLPDSWELAQPGFDMNNPADGAADADHDGMSNAAEYIAGTDYLDPTSKLEVEIDGAGGATIWFLAMSNRTYTVLYSDGLNPVYWRTLGNVLARTNAPRVESVIDPAPRNNRFYRLLTPARP